MRERKKNAATTFTHKCWLCCSNVLACWMFNRCMYILKNEYKNVQLHVGDIAIQPTCSSITRVYSPHTGSVHIWHCIAMIAFDDDVCVCVAVRLCMLTHWHCCYIEYFVYELSEFVEFISTYWTRFCSEYIFFFLLFSWFVIHIRFKIERNGHKFA